MAISIRFVRRRRQLKGNNAPQPAFFSLLSGQRTTASVEQFFAPALAWVQAKLTVNQPGDAHEQEADKMAAHVVQRAPMKPDEEKVQRKARPDDDDMMRRKARPAEEKLHRKDAKDEEKLIQKLPAAAGAAPAAVPVAAQRLRATKGQGSALPPATLREMSQAFGHDFREVRIHTASQAEQLSQDLRAQAFTNGQDVYFGSGKYNPETTDGKLLLAHELTHVVQQNGRAPEQLQRYPMPGGLACADVADWLDSHSPYAPEWAQTKCTYAFNGRVRVQFQTLPGGSVRAIVSGKPKLSVAITCPIDHPSWNPTARPHRTAEAAAWAAMKSTLLAHEQRHVQLGEQQRLAMQTNFRALHITVTGSDQAGAQAQAQQQMNSQQQQWAAAAQAAQDTIDPFRGATVNCP